MPLIMSPIDGSPMRQVTRHGIEIDVCPTSGGVWLDKGELEKLAALMRADATDTAFNRKETAYDDDEDYDRKSDHDWRRKRRKSKLSEIADIFDF